MTAENPAHHLSVTVLGLGDMGSAIARTFADRGFCTTVWNRTASKGAPWSTPAPLLP